METVALEIAFIGTDADTRPFGNGRLPLEISRRAVATVSPTLSGPAPHEGALGK